MKSRHRFCRLILPATVCLSVLGCSGSVSTTQFLDSSYNFAFIERAAVIPLENLSTDRQAGSRATRLLITELLATEALDVIEPGEVLRALGQIEQASSNPSTEQALQLGQALGVQALIAGSVTQSESIRSGSVSFPVVTIDLHMIEVETGATVWAATHTEKGGSAATALIGTGQDAISETTRKCIRKLISTLLE